jgi:hypothetical protein
MYFVRDQEKQSGVETKGVGGHGVQLQGGNGEARGSDKEGVKIKKEKAIQKDKLTSSHKGEDLACTYSGSRFLVSYFSSSNGSSGGG